MAVLDATARARVAAQLMRDARELGVAPWGNHTKQDLAAAVNATDQWIEDNTASWVSALPAAFRTNSNAQQKAVIFAYVLWRRIGRLRAEEDG
jgi:hypothetical protein